MARLVLRGAALAGVAGLLLAGAAAFPLAQAPAASAQTICVDMMNCPYISNSPIIAYPTTANLDAVTAYSSSGPIYVTPGYSVVTPAYTTPATIYVTPTISAASTVPSVAVGPVPDYVSPGGSYCTMPNGGQVWVPSGVSPADMGC